MFFLRLAVLAGFEAKWLDLKSEVAGFEIATMCCLVALASSRLGEHTVELHYSVLTPSSPSA
jgi:hypothetical protein